MKNIIEFFGSNPEAVATLLAFAIGGLISIIAFFFSIFIKYPIVVRQLANRSLVHIDSVLQKNVKVTFIQEEKITEISELRQIDLEIFNGHPRKKIENCTITINLKSSNITVLGVTSSNSDNRPPNQGGRKVTSKIVKVPFRPVDPILGSKNISTFPAIVLNISYLDRILEKDYVFLRITYNGSFFKPEVKGARSILSNLYAKKQRITSFLIFLITMILSLTFYTTSLIMEGIPPYHPELLSNPYHWVGIGLMVMGMIEILIFATRSSWLERRLRPISSPFIPPPTEHTSLNRFHFYNTSKNI